MSKTATLFISHIISEETMFRYNQLKRGCAEFGHDLFWAVDETKVKDSELDPKIKYYKFSYERYSNELPFILYGNKKDEHINSANGVVLLFNEDMHGLYDYIWVVEYDVCMMGEWNEFFRQYENSTADLITKNITHTDKLEYWNKWDFYAKNEHVLMDLVNERKALAKSLNCLSRVSTFLLELILNFLREFDDRSAFYEWVWPSVAYLYGREVVQFQSNRFSCTKIPADFVDFKKGMPYHAIKADVCWNDYLKKYLNDGKSK